MPFKDPDKNREKQRQYQKAYRERHPDRSKKAVKRWRLNNWDKHLAIAKRYRERHPDRVKATMNRVDALPHRVEKRIKYWETISLSMRRAWEKNSRDRRKLKKARNGGTSTLQQWKDRCEFYGNCCAYCGTSTELNVEVDHVIPVSNGGSNWPSNLVPACRSCNARKGAKRWLPKRKASGQSSPRLVTKES